MPKTQPLKRKTKALSLAKTSIQPHAQKSGYFFLTRRILGGLAFGLSLIITLGSYYVWAVAPGNINPPVPSDNVSWAPLYLDLSSTPNLVGSSGGLKVNSLVSCNTIDTDATGKFSCGTDEGGGGGGGVSQVNTGNGLTGGPITTTGTVSVNAPSCSAATSKLLWNGTAFTCGTDAGAAGAGVTRIIAGTANVTLNPAGGTGDVTISVTGGPGAVSSVTGQAGSGIVANPTTGAVVLSMTDKDKVCPANQVMSQFDLGNTNAPTCSAFVSSLTGNNGVTVAPTTGAAVASLTNSVKTCAPGQVMTSFDLKNNLAPTCIAPGGGTGVLQEGAYITLSPNNWNPTVGNATIRLSGLYICPHKMNCDDGRTPAGEWASYGCLGQITNLNYCRNVWWNSGSRFCDNACTPI